MYLSDTRLREELARDRLTVFPVPADCCIQPCSIDLHLGPRLLKYNFKETALTKLVLGVRQLGVDLREPCSIVERYVAMETEGYVLVPGEFVLGSTLESIELKPELCAHVDGRSTLGRLGLLIHVTAGFCDPGFKGHVTLEIKNLGSHDITLCSGIGIAQLLVSEVSGVVQRPYGSSAVGSKYGGFQSGPVPPNLARRL